ncbi:MAG TPA: hypothetical protein VL442_12485 [Mucilaginibacter sp.]|nr:hypothetical protein [Mucilaginibacter sp.]
MDDKIPFGKILFREIKLESDLNVYKNILNKPLAIQQLPVEDREHILYSIDSLIQYAKTRQAYKK